MALPPPRLNELQTRTRVSCANGIADGIVQSATKEPVAGTVALALLEDATELFVAQGQRVLRFDLDVAATRRRRIASAPAGTFWQAPGTRVPLRHALNRRL